MIESGETWHNFAASNVVKTDFSRMRTDLKVF
jgi:hypothetical protein